MNWYNACKLFIIITSISFYSYSGPVISYKKGGRLGDQLICYAVARYIAWKYNFPFFYLPFPYVEQLKIADYERQYDPNMFQGYRIVEIGHDMPDGFAKDENCIYLVSFAHWQVSEDDDRWYGINTDPEFLKFIRTQFLPKLDLAMVSLVKGRLNVAMHVRTGIGSDGIEVRKTAHKKFPQESFYVNQIRELQKIGLPLYVHIFTDDPAPTRLKKRYEHIFFGSEPHIVFGARVSGNCHDKNVLEDLFSMAKFECLIRPKSGFSAIAQVIGNPAVVLYPGGKLKLRDVKVES